MHLKSVTLHPEQYPTREHYPFNLDIFRRTGGLDFRTPVTLFVGENGTGKSTLLEALAIKAGIHIWRQSWRTRFEVNLLELLAKMTAAGHAQFIIATHSPILLSCPAATIYSFDRIPIAPIPYEQTDHYKLYKAFMAGQRESRD
jgi:predicted ATPase